MPHRIDDAMKDAIAEACNEGRSKMEVIDLLHTSWETVTAVAKERGLVFRPARKGPAAKSDTHSVSADQSAATEEVEAPGRDRVPSESAVASVQQVKDASVDVAAESAPVPAESCKEHVPVASAYIPFGGYTFSGPTTLTVLSEDPAMEALMRLAEGIPLPGLGPEARAASPEYHRDLITIAHELGQARGAKEALERARHRLSDSLMHS